MTAETEKIKSEVDTVKNSIESTKDKLTKIKDKKEYATYKMAFNEDLCFKFVKECLTVAKPALEANVNKIKNIVDKISKFGNNPDIINIKKDLRESFIKVLEALNKLKEISAPEEKKILIGFINFIDNQKTKIS